MSDLGLSFTTTANRAINSLDVQVGVGNVDAADRLEEVSVEDVRVLREVAVDEAELGSWMKRLDCRSNRYYLQIQAKETASTNRRQLRGPCRPCRLTRATRRGQQRSRA